MVFLAKLLFFSIYPLFSLNPFPINNNPTKWVIPINKIGLGKYYLTQTSTTMRIHWTDSICMELPQTITKLVIILAMDQV